MKKRKCSVVIFCAILCHHFSGVAGAATSYAIVDTGQTDCFNSNGAAIACPDSGSRFFGQDAQYDGNQPRYRNNGDGTVSDLITGLMWQKGFSKMGWNEASQKAASATTGGYTDWRVPTNKEMYSLIDFTGNQGSGDPSASTPPADAVPFIDTEYFDFEYPTGSRYIDAQYITSTVYTGTVCLDGVNQQQAFFGVNLADGRIKGYPTTRTDPEFYARFVRDNASYGVNDFINSGDGEVVDEATGLAWMKVDSGASQVSNQLSGYTYSDGSLNWEEALDFCENLSYAGHSDWRLPNAKELHSIVDYSRSPDYSGSAAINQIFSTTSIINEGGAVDYPGFWSSTSFEPGTDGIVIYFGEALGYLHGLFLDVHGAGAQRTDAKKGLPSAGSGPQGDVRRVYNYARCVRDAGLATAGKGNISSIYILLLK